MNRLERKLAKFHHLLDRMLECKEELSEMIVFSNFDDYEKQPYVGETSQGIVVEWHGLELQEDDILECMQDKGYIEPQDFTF